MTRFARAKGSKASNERVEEEATSWTEIQQQLNAKKEEIVHQKKQKEADLKRKKNYDNFLKQVEEDDAKKSEWADFPATLTTQKKKKSQQQNSTKTVSKTSESITLIDQSVPEVKKTGKILKKRKREAVEMEETQDTKVQLDKNEGIAKKTKKMKANNLTNQKSAKTKKKKKPEAVVAPVKKSVEEMTEEERKKFEKKKEKKLQQLEKRKLKKLLLKQEKEAQNTTSNGNNIETNNNNKIPPKKMPPKKEKKPNHEPKRRKPIEDVQKVNINGKDIELVYFDGFPIKREDAERLKQLRKQMISKGLPRSEVKTAMKLERRRAEKALARDKKNVCYNCRQSGHVLSECPAITNDAGNVDTAATGICFKCGSTEHTSFVCKVVKSQEFRFASCFICKEQGHISWQCPDNARGLYPKGGACKLCGDVTHLKKDCPKHVAEQEAKSLSLPTLAGDNPDSLEPHASSKPAVSAPKINKVIKF